MSHPERPEGDPFDDRTPAEVIRDVEDKVVLYDLMMSLSPDGPRQEMIDLFRELQKQGHGLAYITRNIRHCAKRRGYINPDDGPPTDDERDGLVINALIRCMNEIEEELKQLDAKPDDPDDLGDDERE